MKRLFIICVSVFLLVGCSKNEGKKPILNDISFTADITYYNEKYTAKGSVDGKGNLCLEMIEPSELSGMVFTVDDRGVKVEYKGLTFSPNVNSLSGSAADMIYSGFSAVRQENVDYEYGDKNYTVTAKNNNTEFVLCYSPSGLPLEIKSSSGVFKTQFYDIKTLKNE